MRQLKTAEECLRLAMDCLRAAEVADYRNKVRWIQLAARWDSLAQARGSNVRSFRVYHQVSERHNLQASGY
jgi:hypothetical protein